MSSIGSNLLVSTGLAVAALLAAMAQGPPPPAPRDPGTVQSLERPVLGTPASRILARRSPNEHALPVALDDLRAAPLPLLGRRVEFTLVVAPDGPTPDPLWTRFSPAKWRSIRAWSDAQFPWRKEHFENAAQHLFTRRGSAEELALATARPYERFVVTATVREVVMSEPWIEIEHVRRSAVALGEGTVLHAARAVELAAAKQTELALTQLERALAAPLPENARKELERLRDLWRTPPAR